MKKSSEVEIAMAEVKKDVKYLKEGQDDLKQSFKDLCDKIDKFIVESKEKQEKLEEKYDQKYASKNTEKVVYVMVGTILTTVLLAVLGSVLG